MITPLIVDGNVDARNGDLSSIIDSDSDYRGDVGQKAAVSCDAPRMTPWRASVGPSGFFGWVSLMTWCSRPVSTGNRSSDLP
ncbi:MAG: hypothetical protein IPJ07_09160 [Acidobacteria bacterium]|nr:hypothetical protein [Acidobacteriota bacterium]